MSTEIKTHRPISQIIQTSIKRMFSTTKQFICVFLIQENKCLFDIVFLEQEGERRTFVSLVGFNFEIIDII